MRNTVVLLLFLATASTARAGVLQKGDRMVELDVATDASGHPFKLKSLRGKWLVVTVGADWCKPCAKELPAWDKLAASSKARFVAIDIDNDREDGKRFHARLKLAHMTRVYLPADHSAVVGSYGQDTMPSTFVIDPQGIVQYVHQGYTDGDDKDLRHALDNTTR